MKRLLIASTIALLAVSSTVSAQTISEETTAVQQQLVKEQDGLGVSGTGLTPGVIFALLVLLALSADGGDDVISEEISDVRLKTDITQIGTAENGLPLYTFRYKGLPTVYQGVMAQDVLNVMPEAVETTIFGTYKVNYGMIGVPFERLSD